ncbi:MAG: LysR family transcriptional regulator [Tepidisphaeraceae bacterium]
MEISQLEYVVAIAECRSMTRAAQRCGVAQPSLSQQLQKLERELGLVLFDRVGRGMLLTDAGRAFLPRARRILAEVGEVTRGLRQDIDQGAGSLSIGAIPTIAPYLLPDALVQLRKSRPACDVSIREDLTERLIDALVGGELDCAFFGTAIDHPLLDTEPLGEEELLVITPPGSRWKGRLLPEQLKREPTIVLDEMHCLGRQIEGFCSARGWGRRVVCRSTQLMTILELVRTGIGISLVPEMALATMADPGMRVLRLERNRPRRSITVAWRRDRRRPGAAIDLVAAARKNLAGLNKRGLARYI